MRGQDVSQAFPTFLKLLTVQDVRISRQNFGNILEVAYFEQGATMHDIHPYVVFIGVDFPYPAVQTEVAVADVRHDNLGRADRKSYT